MKEYIEKLHKVFVPNNDGYSFIKNVVVFLPVYETQLSITKRVAIKISLLEEMVLQLINEKIHNLEELSNILGINKKLLEITIADLHVKNMIYYSSNNCTLKPEGRVAINELKRIERKTDILRNVHLDALNGNIIKDYDSLDFVLNCNDDNKKLKPSFDPDNIELYRQRIKDIKEIFNFENNYYEDKTKAQPDELVSLDSIEKVFVKFLRIPLHLYVSNVGKDIDFIYKTNHDRVYFQDHKLQILNQIKDREVLKDTFKTYTLNKKYERCDFEENAEIISAIKDYLLNKKKNNSNYIKNLILSNRKLFDGEIELFLELLFKDAIKIDLYIGTLDDLIWNQDTTGLFDLLKTKKYVEIIYNNSNNEKDALRRLTGRYPEMKGYKQQAHNYFMKFVINDSHAVLATPEEVSVIDGKLSITKIDYFFFNLN